MRNRAGSEVPDRRQIRAIWRPFVTGMTPAMTGSSIFRARIRYRKLYSTPLSKNIWVVRKSQPLSTFCLR